MPRSTRKSRRPATVTPPARTAAIAATAAAAGLCGPLAVHAAEGTPPFRHEQLTVFSAAAAAREGKSLTRDGDLSDWRPETFVEMVSDPTLRDRFGMTLATAYDDSGILFAAHYTDATPMVNFSDPTVEPGLGWRGDALQIRFITDTSIGQPVAKEQLNSDKIAHFTLWYSSPRGVTGLDARYGMDLHGAVSREGEATGLVYRKDADGKGYTVEGRIPWSLLKVSGPPPPGSRWLATLQPLWGDAIRSYPLHHFYEILRTGGFPFQTPNVWGDALFVGPKEAKSALTALAADEAKRRAAMIAAAEGKSGPNVVAVRYTNPRAGFVSLAICRADTGAIVRTLLTKARRPAGAQTEPWDGLNDDGKPVPMGHYRVKALVHDGIKPHYVTSVMNSGSPAWGNSGGSHGWGADHGVPVATAADENGNVYLAWTFDEGGDYLIRTDKNGQKQWGAGLSWGEFDGDVTAVLYDNGRVYTARDGAKGHGSDTSGKPIHGGLFAYDAKTGARVNFAGGKGAIPVTEWTRPADATKADLPVDANLVALAATPTRILCALRYENKVVALDKTDFTVRETYSVPRPLGIACDAAGTTLYAVSGTSLVSLPLGDPGAAPKMLVKAGDALVSPFGLALGRDNALYVTDRGAGRQQVTVFDAASGRLLRRIGKTGGRPAIGKYDAAAMYSPAGICVDTQNRVWVAEADQSPKRISLWDAKTGALRREFFGAAAYSVMMAPDPQNPEWVYTHNMRWKVDYETGKATPDAVIYRGGVGGALPGKHFYGFMGNSFSVARYNGHQFAYDGMGGVYTTAADRFRPAAYVGSKVGDLEVTPELKAKTAGGIWWQDGNGDGRAQPDEAKPLPTGLSWRSNNREFGGNLFPGAVFISGGRIYKPKGMTAQGVPIYPTPAEAEPLQREDGEAGRYSNRLDVWPSLKDDWKSFYAIASLPDQKGRPQGGGGDAIMRYTPDGRVLWRYRRVTMHFALNAPLARTGDLTGALRLVGEVENPVAKGGEILGVGCYRGYYGFLNEDGLFVDQVGYDNGRGPAPGIDTFFIENFSGYLFRHPKTKKVYLFCGDVDARILELQGFDSIQRFDSELDITAGQVAQATALAGKAAAVATTDAAAPGPLAVPTAAARPLLDGSGSGFGGESQAATIALDESSAAKLQLSRDADAVYVRFQVPDASPWQNAGGDWRLLFKTGDAVDIQIGDVRVLLAPENGAITAVGMWKRVPDGMTGEPFTYRSPTGSEVFQRVARIPEVRGVVKPQSGGYVLEAALPWKALGIMPPAAGAVVKGDVGVLQSDSTGVRTLLRRYRFNRDTTVTNDVPTEVRVHAERQGAVVFP